MTKAPEHPTSPETRDQTNLSGSRAIDGVSENTASIPVVGPGAKGRRDRRDDLVDPSLTAPPARTSRRALIMNSIISAAALTSAVAVASPVENGMEMPNEDVNLLALGQKLDRLRSQYVVQRAKDAKKKALFEAEVEAATGIKRNDAPDRSQDKSGYWKKRSELATAASTSDPDFTEWEKLIDRLSVLVQPIFGCTAKTAAGLAVQANAASMACEELWDDECVGNEGSLEVERVFIEAVCRYAGIAPYALSDVSLQPTIASDDEALILLGHQLAEAWRALGDACSTLSVAEGKIFDWRHLNPEPHPDEAPQQQAYQQAIQAWRDREAEAERLSGYDKAKEGEDRANDEVSRFLDAIRNTPARNMYGLIAKARAAEQTQDSDLAWSVIDDLVGMKAAAA